MSKKKIPIILVGFFILLIPFKSYSEGILLHKDMFLNSPILGPEDLPEEITFTLYDSPIATIPIGSQTFQRGQYTVDFEFSKSDGITSGNVARVTAEFTDKLDINSDSKSVSKTKEIWAGIEVGGTVIGERTKVSDRILVQLLLASDASIASYLTLAYRGDDNPITTIYKDLPLSYLERNGSESSLSRYFSAVATGTSEDVLVGPNDVAAGSNGQIQYNKNNVQTGASDFYYDDTHHKVGIGTANPDQDFHIYRGGGNDVICKIDSDNDQYFLFAKAGVPKWCLLSGFPNGTENFSIRSYFAGGAVMTFKENGNIGIGTTTPTHKLAVNGTIRAKEIIVDTLWSDFVFKSNYQLPSLYEIEQFIREKKHLPGVPTEGEVRNTGVTLGNISSKLLQKIEELTLYMIELKKENDFLKTQIDAIQKQFDVCFK